LKKYLEIAKISFKTQITWRFDVIMNVLFTVSKMLFAYILWGAIFSKNETVAGFTFPMMLSYYILSSFLSQIEMSGGVSSEIGDHIKGGTFSKYMVVPVNTRGYFVAHTFGSMAFYLIFNLVAIITWVLIFRIDFIITSNIVIILASICMIIIGLLFMIQLNYFLGIPAFLFQDIWIFLMIKNNIVAFITGTLIPLTLLPQSIIWFMRFFPFYYVTYLPSMLLIGKNENEAIIGIVILTAWLLFFTFLNKFAYNKLRIVFDGAGI